MIGDKMMVAKGVPEFKAAQWQGFIKLAKRFPDHHVLGVELVRTFEDETAAVFTVVRNKEPVRYIVFGDAKGRVQSHHDCSAKYQHRRTAFLAAAAPPPPSPEDGDASPNFAFGPPPVEQEPTPGVVAMASAMLPAAFDVGEYVTSK